MMMRRIRNHPTALILPARTVLKKVAGKNSVKSFHKNLCEDLSHPSRSSQLDLLRFL